eukprot:gene24875-10536_t
MDEDAPLTEGWEVESYSKALLDSVPGTASSFIFPASWPNRIDVGVLAGSSVLSSVRRDFSILDYFLAACDGTAFGAVDLQVLRDAPPSVLCMLPRSVLAPLLHGAAAAVGREVKGTELHNPIALQQLAWAAVNVMVQRACVMDAELRRLYVTRLAEKIKVRRVSRGLSESSTGQLALMISQLVHRQLDHPLTTSLNTATETALSCTGMPASLLSLLPLDHTYNQLAKPFLSCTSGDAWKLAAHLASRWKALQTHLAHYELVSQVQRAAPLAVAAGCATYLEASFWRSGRPDERAESEAQHPCIDWLHAVFSTVAEVEHMALVSVDLEWTSALAVTIGSVQHWREGLWRVVHGPLHTWAPASAASSETEVDHDRLVWTWQKMDKQLSRLATSLEGSVTSPSAKDSVLLAASRLLHIREGMCKVLDLLLIPPKPLLWRHGGKPLLPQSRSLILGQIQLQALAALLAVGPEGFQVDPMGAPMALAAMGVRLPQLEMHGVGHESSSADMLQRQRVSQVVVASLCSDVQFKQKVASGLSLLMFIPAMTLAAASDPATNSKALAVTAASAAAANSKAISVSGVHLPEGPKQGAPAAPALAMNRTQRREQEKQGGEIVSALLSELNKRALVAADECQGSAEALCEAAWLLKVSSSLALSAKSQPGADSGGSQEVSTMPAYMMISPVCQRLQLQLISLFDLSSLRTQRELLAGSILITANLALAQSTSGQPGSSGPQDSLATSELLALARQQWATFQAGGGRSPSDGVPYQQLVWVLEELAFAQGESNSPRGANKPNHLSEVVLPSVLNEMWLRWHQAMWSGARSCTPSAASAMAAIAPAGMQDTTLSACPSRLYLASYSAAMAALVQNMASTAAEGWTGTAAVLPSNLCAAAKPSDVTFIWQALTGLYVQALLAHISSLPETMPQDVPVFKWQKRKSQISKGGSPRQSLVEMMESLLQCVDQTKSIDFNSAPKRQLWLANLGALLSLSTHPTLLLILEQVVLPCADALLHQADQGIQVPLVAAALPLHGRVWLLLGLLRLHLVLPPAGVDPAGKYSLKAQQLLLHISEGIDPEITVRQALQQLPGGPDESTHLVHLHEQRGSASTKLQAAVARIVPRPVPSQYKTLAAEVKSFVASFASLPRIQSLLGDLSRTPATQSAGYEAAVWQANAGSWLERLVKQYPMYLDIIQPVQLAVEEMRHGMSLLKAAVAVRSPAQQEQLALTSCIASGLMSFPLALPQPQTPESTQTASTKHKKALSTSASPTLCISGAPLPTSHLAEAGPHTVLFQLAGEAARAAAPQHLTSTQLDRIAELASYTTSLHAARAALLAACREILVAGTTGTPNTTSLERLFAFFFNSWKKLREFEEARAEEEAEQFKSKAVTSTFKTDEEEAEEDFKKSHPDHFILFKDISGPLEGELLDGDILEDIVRVHTAVYQSLQLVGAVRPDSSTLLGPAAVDKIFSISYDLGADLLGVLGGLDASVDSNTLVGHLYRCSSEYTHLARATESTAAEVVAAASGIAIGSKRSRKRGKDAASDKFTAIDVQVSCVEEVSLLQAPVTAVEIRLRELLEEFPTHPLLEQLLAICTRCLELPLTTPLKTALTGLELLLARAQLWETTAAKYVAITAQLRDVAALAMRWRSLELASWRATLKHVSQRHASGAAKNWFHLFQLLILGMPEPEAATEPAEERRNKSKRKRRSETKAELDPVTKQYRSTAATLEAFLQTSTLGEFEARLQLLRSFMCHVKLRLAEAEAAQESSSSPDTALVAAGAFGIDHPGSRKYLPLVVGALANTVAYYAQFSGAVRSALESGLSPIEKDLDDFVRLAKWEDRGYYAMKASTEKAQRYLHRLKRRAEEVLAQAAASVLATSVKAMGVAELMAAKPPPPPVTVAPKEAGATDKLDAAVEKESAKKAKVTPKKVTPKPPADAASTLPAASGLEMSEVDGSALLRDDLCLGAANIQTWSKLCSAAVAEAIAAQPAGSSATTPQASAQLPYHRRVPQLTKQLSKVLNSVVAAAGVAGGVAVTGVAGVEGDAADQESEGYPAAMYVDELAVGAASRAAELKDDIAKGARLRKKKALSDYTKALMAMGVSKRASDVPAGKWVVLWVVKTLVLAEVASWFSKAPANLDPLLKLLPGSKHSLSKLPAVNEEALAGASRSRTRADVYYYRSVARVQKLWSASKQPHTDLSPPEVAALQRLSEHLLFMCRRQRSMLSDVVDSHAAITQLCNWLSTLTSGHSDNRLQGEQQLVEVGIGRSDADPTSDSSSPPSLPPPQALACTWMGRLKQVLDRLASVLPDTVQLLAVLLEVNTEASQRSHLQQAAAVVDVWNSSVEGWKQDLETNMADTGLTIHKRENALSCCWVSDHSWSHLVSTFSAIDDLYTSLDTLMQASKNDGSESTQWPSSVPGLEPLMAEVTAAAAEAQAFAQATRPSSLGALGVSLASDACGQASGAAGKTSAGQAGAAEGADSVVPEGFTSHVEAAIQGVLLWAQSALSVTEKKAPGAPGAAAQGQLKKEEEEAEEEEEEECNIPQCVDSLLAHTQVARVGKVAAATSSVLLQLAEARDSLFSESSASDLQPSQERVQQVQLMTQQARSLYPMLCLLGGVLQQLSLRAIALHKSTAKLAYITSSIFATLVEEGYCVPEGEGEGKDGGDGNGEFKECEGTGMGDGEGKKDVSDKIEDEDQLRGAQQKGKEPKEKEENGPEEGPEGEEKGVEMNDDFDGSLHDIDAPKEERDGESSEDEEGDDDRIDQQMGDLGENEEEEKYKEDAPIQVDDKNDLDYGAGEEQDDEKDEQGGDKPKPEKPKGKDAKEEEQTKMDLDGEDEGGVNDDFDDKYEDNEFTKPEAPEEELELPDDMNLDGGKEAEGEDEKEGGDDEKDGEGPPEDVEGKVGDDGEDGEDKPGDRGDVEMPEGEEPEANDDAGMGQEAADQEDGGEKDEGADKEEDPPAPAHGRGEEEDAPTPAEQQQAGPEGVESAAPIAASTGEARGKQQEEPEEPVGMEDQQAPQAGNTAEDDDTAPDTAPQARQGNVGQSSAAPKGGAAPLKGGDKQQPPQPKDKNSRGKQQRQEPNPLRNLGDAMERWKADLAVNHEAPQDKKEEEEEGAAHDEDAAEDAGPTSAVEHQFLGANEQRLEGDTQALAPATEDQAQKLEGEQDAREEEEAGAEVVDAMDEDEVDPGGGDDEPEPGKQPLAGVAPKQWAGAQKNAKLAADKEEEEEEEVGGEGAGDDADALAALDLGGHGGEPDGLEDGIFSSVVAKFGEEKQPGEQEQARDVVSTTGLSEERADALRQQLDERLRAPVAEDPSGSERYGAELWSRCEALTAGLSSELTEQLRLILEPTLASKLAGDYRTGRDKIWMRRTRPDKRRYQVMLAIDDSRSMAENSCGGVALEALTLICKSMSRLEVGQVGVIKFGGSDGVVPLQSLDTPFSDAVGPKLVGSLRFAQDNTLADQPMLDLMTSLTHMLDVARHQGGAGGIGVGTQKESLHAVVREMAAKQGVCLVFIVLDNPQNSLSDMQSVSFLNNKPVFSKYLDSFPFPFYILLRDISALPRTLAELLRQWFELSAH